MYPTQHLQHATISDTNQIIVETYYLQLEKRFQQGKAAKVGTLNLIWAYNANKKTTSVINFKLLHKSDIDTRSAISCSQTVHG